MYLSDRLYLIWDTETFIHRVFQCGDIAYCGNFTRDARNTTIVSRKCDCRTNYYNSSIICNIAACPEGYSGDSTSATCTDIDECETGICGSNASCLNTPGSFICTCDAGYYLVNGHICMNTSVLVLSKTTSIGQPMVISFNGKIDHQYT